VTVALGIDLLWMGARAGGTGRYVAELMGALLAAGSGVRLTAFVPREIPPDLAAAPWSGEVRWAPLPVSPSGRAQVALRVAGLPLVARRRRLDVLHSPANVGALRSPAVAHVLTLLDLIWLHHPEAWEADPAAQRAIRRLALRSARRADRVLAISNAARDDLVAEGLDPERVDVTRLGVRVDAGAPATPEPELRTRLNLADGPIVLCVAQKRPYKNIASLVRVMPALAEHGAVLVVPGAPTDHERELRALAAELGVSERVRFPTYVGEEDLEGLYRAAACFVLPSLIEGFGLPVLEAMARGVPVACSDRSALPEVAGGAALLFDPSDREQIRQAVQRLLGERDFARELGERGRRRAAEMSWERTARATLASYERAIAARR
jgi:glycosyltransferase involved in cell wall biosynthesis